MPLYAAPGDTILTQDTKVCNAIATVYGTGSSGQSSGDRILNYLKCRVETMG